MRTIDPVGHASRQPASSQCLQTSDRKTQRNGSSPSPLPSEMRADDLTSFFPVLLEKHDVAPGRRAEVAGVVVGISRPSEAVIGHVVPFLARDFASFAADANSRVGKKSYFDVIAHVGVPPLIRAMSAFADHASILAIVHSFSFHRVAAAALAAPAAGSSGCKITGPPCGTYLSSQFKRGTARQSARHDVAGERLGFHDRDIRLARNRKKIIRGAAMHRAGRTEMKRHRDLVHCFAIELQRPNTAANERARFDRSAQTDDANIIAVPDLELARKFGGHFGKHLRLQLREMAEKTRHASGGMMFGQAVSCQNERKSRVARRREPIFLARKPVHRRIRVARVKRVVTGDSSGS